MKNTIKWGAIAVLSVWLAGFVSFLYHVPHQRAPASLRTDAIVVFTGLENMRTRQGIETYRTGGAPLLLISGVDPAVTKTRLLRWLYRHPPRNLNMDFTLGYQAANTVGNAEETAAWACANGVKSIRLTTADYHMPRALFLLHLAWPDVEVTPDPLVAPYGHLTQQPLYTAWGLWQSFVEFHKLTVQRTRYLLGRLAVPTYHCTASQQEDFDHD
jgi:uncharacterized SAM-binding protein YcdF (DUF218 family)